MITIYCDVLLNDNGDDIKLTMIILWLIEMNKEDMNDDNNNTDKDVLWYVVKDNGDDIKLTVIKLIELVLIKLMLMMIKICSKVEDGDENDDEDDDDHDDDLGPGSSANVQAVQQVIFYQFKGIQ